MVEVDFQRLELERREVGILLRISCGWLVLLLFLSPVAGLRPLRDRTNSWGDEVCLLLCEFLVFVVVAIGFRISPCVVFWSGNC